MSHRRSSSRGSGPPLTIVLPVMLLVLAFACTESNAQPGGTARQKKQATGERKELSFDAAGSNDSDVVAHVREKFSDEQERLNRQRTIDGLALLPEPIADAPRALVDVAHYGISSYQGQHGPQRFLALHLLIDNPGSAPLTVSSDDVTIKIDGEKRVWAEVPPLLKGLTWLYGGQSFNLQKVERFQQLKVPTRGVNGTWFFLADLPSSPEVPTILLQLRAGGKVLEVDVTASQRAVLGLTLEKAGPHGCLALVTIRGLLNSINVESLVDQLERTAEQKIVRYVIQWAEGAPAPDQQLGQWLVNSAAQLGSGRPVGEQYPTLPARIRELHLVQPAEHKLGSPNQYGSAEGEQRLHDTAAAAVSAALKTAYLSLPKNELLQEMTRGNVLTRAAAITHGAEQFDARQLPELLRLANDSEPVIQLAAIRALGHFQEPAALKMLLDQAQKNVEPTSAAAIESLAGSRFSAAQDALLQLLRQGNPAVKRLTMQVLAQHPRSKWSETIYEFVTDPREGLSIEGIRALLQVGHPQLVNVLEAGLKSPDSELRRFVFPILAQRDDARSEQLAAEYTLAHLQHDPPDGPMTQFLLRTKLPEAIPLLLAQFETGSERLAVLHLLAQIGNDSVGDAIARRYPKLPATEQSAALQALRILRNKHFLGFAGQALLTSDLSLIQSARQELTQDASTEACRLLIAALEKQTNSTALSNICTALGNIGGPEARAALLKARDSGIPERKKMALGALKFLYRHSPGYAYIWPAESHVLQQQWTEAIEYYDLALQIDPELPDAYSGRGNMWLRLGKETEATQDFEQAYRLDPYNSAAITGLAYGRVRVGKIDDGLKILNGGREDLKHDATFLYNAACTYAQALDEAIKNEKLPNREQRLVAYRQQALADLRQSISRGFVDFEWMQKDPDLNILHDDPEYKKLIGDRPATPKAEPVEPPDADVEE